MILKLTRAQRSSLFAGDWPRISGEGEAPVAPGDVHQVSRRLAIEILRIRKPKKGGWSVEYRVIDHRDHEPYLLPTARSLRLDNEKGEPVPMTKEEELGYTHDPRRGISAGRAVPSKYQNVLSMQGHSRHAEHKRAERAEEETREDLRRLNCEIRELAKRAAKMGVDPTQVLAPIAREIASQHANIRDAA